jgi:hypothetical protein
VLLPSDTHRKPITSITAALLLFLTYLLTLPRTYLKIGYDGIRYICDNLVESSCRAIRYAFPKIFHIGKEAIMIVASGMTPYSLVERCRRFIITYCSFKNERQTRFSVYSRPWSLYFVFLYQYNCFHVRPTVLP